ncbi:MAG: DUF4388 domain-containing protein [Candidatus Melainabacteria bacterium]|nr:DUF4388 domain-containing protein [Candidatus Melainabacteria bacterium]
MTGQSNFSQTRPILASLPKEEDLLVMVELSKNQRGVLIEQMFVLFGSHRFCLQTVIGRRVGEEDPTWYLYSGENKNKLEWILQTADINQVLSSIASIAAASTNNSLISPSLPEPQPTTSQGGLAPIGYGLPAHGQERPRVADPVPLGTRGLAQPPMEGDLSKLSIDSVLDSITRGKLTGRLECHVRGDKLEVIFENGNARHAASPTARGEDALIELMTALEGNFRFVPSVSTEPRSIFRRTEELSGKAKSIIDLGTFLERAGIKLNTRLTRNHASLSEQEFEAAVSPLVPLDLEIQKRFYQLIDNKSALLEIIDKGKFNRCHWIPALYNLMSGSLVTAEEEMVEHQNTTGNLTIGIDRSTVEQFAKSHIYSDTGIVTFVALLYFIEQEFYRYECFQSPFSLVMIKPRIVRGGQDFPISQEQRAAVLAGLSATKRKADLLAHFQQDDFALLLPQTTPEGVRSFAGRLVEALKPGPQPVGINLQPGEIFSMSVGIASLPDDCQDWVKLVAFLNQNQRRF